MVIHRGDVHHIYPKNYLKNQGVKQNKYNQIGNYALTEQPINLKISDKNPADYFTEVIKQCKTKQVLFGSIDSIEELKENFRMNCIPSYMIQGKIPEFDVFLKDRQKLMAMKIKEYYEAI